jgi:hypothetical protein
VAAGRPRTAIRKPAPDRRSASLGRCRDPTAVPANWPAANSAAADPAVANSAATNPAGRPPVASPADRPWAADRPWGVGRPWAAGPVPGRAVARPSRPVASWTDGRSWDGRTACRRWPSHRSVASRPGGPSDRRTAAGPAAAPVRWPCRPVGRPAASRSRAGRHRSTPRRPSTAGPTGRPDPCTNRARFRSLNALHHVRPLAAARSRVPVTAVRGRCRGRPRTGLAADSEVAALLLLALDRLEQRLEVALAESEGAVPLNQLEENRGPVLHRFREDLQQVPVLVSVDEDLAGL